MDAELDMYMKQLDDENKNLHLENSQLKREVGHTSIFAGAINENLIQYQLDLSEEKEKIDHLLRGHVIKRDNLGTEYWSEPDDPTSKSLTNYGVERLMNVINFYLSRNIILSNYDQETIDNKMKDLGWELADAIFLEYEYIFYKPTIQDLIKRDKEIFKSYFKEYKKATITKEELISQIKSRLISYKDEIERIYKKNLKQYPLICRVLIDTIHSAYLRALNGEERSSLRKTMSIVESKNDSLANKQTIPTQGGSRWNPLKWLRS